MKYANAIAALYRQQKELFVSNQTRKMDYSDDRLAGLKWLFECQFCEWDFDNDLDLEPMELAIQFVRELDHHIAKASSSSSHIAFGFGDAETNMINNYVIESR